MVRGLLTGNPLLIVMQCPIPGDCTPCINESATTFTQPTPDQFLRFLPLFKDSIPSVHCDQGLVSIVRVWSDGCGQCVLSPSTSVVMRPSTLPLRCWTIIPLSEVRRLGVGPRSACRNHIISFIHTQQRIS